MGAAKALNTLCNALRCPRVGEYVCVSTCVYMCVYTGTHLPPLPTHTQSSFLGSLRARGLSCFSHVRLFATAWTVACWASLFMGFSRQEY